MRAVHQSVLALLRECMAHLLLRVTLQLIALLFAVLCVRCFHPVSFFEAFAITTCFWIGKWMFKRSSTTTVAPTFRQSLPLSPPRLPSGHSFAGPSHFDSPYASDISTSPQSLGSRAASLPSDDLEIQLGEHIGGALIPIREFIIRDFIEWWYDSIRGTPQVRYRMDEQRNDESERVIWLARQALNRVLTIIGAAATKLDLVSFIVKDCLTIFKAQLQEFRRSRARAQQCFGSRWDQLPVTQKERILQEEWGRHHDPSVDEGLGIKRVHKAVCSDKRETAYFESLSEPFLKIVLHPENYESKLVRRLMKDIVVHKIFKMGFTWVDPDQINMWFLYYFSPMDEELDESRRSSLISIASTVEPPPPEEPLFVRRMKQLERLIARRKTKDELKESNILKNPRSILDIRLLSWRRMGTFMDPYIAYMLEVSSGRDRWTVFRRYKQFKLLHESLMRAYPKACDLLHLPPAKVMGLFNDELIRDRADQLGAYLKIIIGDKKLADCDEIWSFVGASKSRTHHRSHSTTRNLFKNSLSPADLKAWKEKLDVRERELQQLESRVKLKEWEVKLEMLEKKVVKKEKELQAREYKAKMHQWIVELQRREQEAELKDKQLRKRERMLQQRENDYFRTLRLNDSKLTEPIYNFCDEVFQLRSRGWLGRQIMQIAIQTIQSMFDGKVDRYIRKQAVAIQTISTLVTALRALQHTVWPNGILYNMLPSYRYVDRTQEEKDHDQVQVNQVVLNALPSSLKTLIGVEYAVNGFKDIMELCQSTFLVRQLGFTIFENLLVRLFPELGPNTDFYRIQSTAHRTTPDTSAHSSPSHTQH
eukprot:GILK01010591.1.p1 GENE.GILK01010591.1~~GILK01010591.1.p1  ORF type:complete len:819 (+),score=144.67 GILK01010591.1:62-2518(+)